MAANGVVYGFLDPSKQSARTTAIQSLVQSKRLGRVTYRYPEAMDAIVAAIQTKREDWKRPVAVCGSVEDLQPPLNVDVGTWANGLFYFLEEAGIPLIFLDNDQVKIHLGPQGAVIRQYHKAVTFLRDEVQRRLLTDEDKERAIRGIKYGRPPYGYRMRKGRLVTRPDQVAAIKEIFKMFRNSKTMHQVLVRLQIKFKTERDLKDPKRSKPQYWDHVKIRRILNKASLYCRGEFLASTGEKLVYPGLAILPPEWVDTQPGQSPSSAGAPVKEST